jgi:hypothetical protein
MKFKQDGTYIQFTVPGDILTWAHAFRADRAAQYAKYKHFERKPKHKPVVGDILEAIFDAWLLSLDIPHIWYVDQPINGRDFDVLDLIVDTKSLQIKKHPYGNYLGLVTARMFREEVTDIYAFGNVYLDQNIGWITGFASKRRMLRLGKHMVEGDQHENYTVPKGHEVFGIVTENMMPPLTWLNKTQTMTANERAFVMREREENWMKAGTSRQEELG